MEGDVASLGAGIAMGVGALGPGIGIGLLASSAMQSIGRNPDTKILEGILWMH